MKRNSLWKYRFVSNCIIFDDIEILFKNNPSLMDAKKSQVMSLKIRYMSVI